MSKLIKSKFQAIFIFAFMVLASSWGAGAEEACEPSKGITPYCGFTNPEDIVHVPDSPFLIISQYGGHLTRVPSSLVLFHMESEAKTTFFPKDTVGAAVADLWGEEACTAPPAFFSPHGIDLIRRADGELMLLVVNHEADVHRDSVQMFRVVPAPQTVFLEWRGCVHMSAGMSLNDVAAIPSGGFVVGVWRETQKASPALQQKRERLPQVSVWKKGQGLSTLVAFDSPGYINGVSITPDETIVIANDSLNGKIMQFSYPDGRVMAERMMLVPDNNSWAADGRLLITSLQPATPDAFARCDREKLAVCDVPFEILALDPLSMQLESLFWHDGSTPFGEATVTVQVGEYLYMGVGLGDRIARIKYPVKASKP